MPRRIKLAALTPFIAGAAAFALLAALVLTGASEPFDVGVMHSVRGPAWTWALAPLRVITDLAATWVVTGMAVGAVLVGRVIGRPRKGFEAGVTILLAWLVNTGVKFGIARPRPKLFEPLVVEIGYSFPSGHAALGMVTYGVLAVLIARSPLDPRLRRTVVATLVVVVALIGLSRIWLGVHYPTDVLAGWLMGGMVVAAYAALTRSGSRPDGSADLGGARPRPTDR